MESHIEQLKDLLRPGSVCMVGTIDSGRMHFRPMYLADVDEMGSLWFFTSLGSPEAGEVQEGTYVEVVYSEKDNMYISASGMGLVGNKNRAKMEELFDAEFAPGIPEGLADPAIALLKVRPTEIDYWVFVEKQLTKVKLLPDLLKQHD